MIRMNLQNGNRLTEFKNELLLAGGRVGVRDSQGVGKGHVHTAVFKMDNQQGPNYIAHGTLFNGMWQAGWDGGLGEKGYMSTYG